MINDARAIERCVDKSMTSFLLHRAGIADAARRWSTEEAARAASGGGPRPTTLSRSRSFGAQGRGLGRDCAGRSRCPTPTPDRCEACSTCSATSAASATGAIFGSSWSAASAVAAMMRHGTSWVTNVAGAAFASRRPAREHLADLALAAASAVGAAYCGVDLIEDRERGLLVLEVNSMPAWKGLQSVAEVDIAAIGSPLMSSNSKDAPSARRPVLQPCGAPFCGPAVRSSRR